LVVEPKFHVSQANFEKTVQTAQKIGLKLCGSLQISLSGPALLKKIFEKQMRAVEHCPHFSHADGCGEM